MLCDLKPISADAAQRALDSGATLVRVENGLYSGGYTYRHMLTTKRGTAYRVSSYVMRALDLKPEIANHPLW
jgi:hypothetical protein